MSNKIINIPGRLHSVSTEGVVTGANEILDDSLNKTQTQFNQETNARIEALQEGTLIIVSELPTTGVAGKIYRVPGDGSYTDYMWDTSQEPAAFIELATYTGNEGDFFNVNVYNGVPTTAYNTADIARANVPVGMRKQGLQITYLLANGWFTDQYIGSAVDSTSWATASNWKTLGPVSVSQNTLTGKTELKIGSDVALTVDNEPEAGSDNLVKSGGVEAKKLDKIYTENLINPSKLTFYKRINSEGTVTIGSDNYCVSEPIIVNGHDMNCNGSTANTARAWVVYDSSNRMLRFAAEGATLYEYQDGDYSIVFGFRVEQEDAATTRANYGRTVIDVVYYDYAPIIKLENEITDLENSISEKVDKEYTANLVDPSKMKDRSYIGNTGVLHVGDGSDGYYISDYVPVNGHDMICNGLDSEVAKPWAVFDESKELRRVADRGQVKYSYQSGDYYIVFGFRILTVPSAARANYDDDDEGLIDIDYSDYAPVAVLKKELEELDDRVTALDGGGQIDSLYSYPHVLYKVWNDKEISRQNALKIGLSRLVNNITKNRNITFNNGMRFIPIVPSEVSQVTETTINYSVGEITENCVIRNIPASTGKNSKPRILVIGDSVTNGYGADSNKLYDWLPSKYWAYAKMYFEMDKIDDGDVGHDVLFIGGFESDDQFTLNYKSITRNVKVKAEGNGGATLQELFTQTWGSPASTNPFYDSVHNTFSILSYLENYRTMDDAGVRLISQSADPHGETVVGSDGNTYTIGQMITSQDLLSEYDICTPTHVFINLNTNTSKSNFESKISDVVDIVKSELPSAVFAWLCIDSTGTYFPKDYPDMEQSMIEMSSLHEKNVGFFNYFHENIEDETDDVYLLGMNFIQPEAIDYAYTEITLPNGIGSVYKIGNNEVLAKTAHPNNFAHAAWGYELYSFIKWLIR